MRETRRNSSILKHVDCRLFTSSKQVKEKERIELRVTVLLSLKTINNSRILAKSEGREFIWGNPVGPVNRRRKWRRWSWSKQWRLLRARRNYRRKTLNGVLAESMIPPAEMWREMLMFV